MYRAGQRSCPPPQLISFCWDDYNILHSRTKVITVLIFHCERGEKVVWTGISPSCCIRKMKLIFSPVSIPQLPSSPLSLKKKHWHFKRNYYPRVKGRNTGGTAFPNLHSPEGPADTGTQAIRAGTGADTDLCRLLVLSRHLHRCELCLPNLASQLTCPAGGEFRHFPNILIAIGLTY